MYWRYLAKKDEESMLSKVYISQKMNPVKNDWVNSLDKNKKEYEIMLDDDQLKSKFKTKDSFKNYLKRKGLKIAEINLRKLKNSHSKLDDIEFKELKCAQYLDDPRINQNEAMLLFKLRTRIYQVKTTFKTNFKNQFNFNLSCNLCT